MKRLKRKKMVGIGTIALAATECAKNFPSDKELYIRVYAYARYNGKWSRLGSVMEKAKAENVYETAGEVAKRVLSGYLSNATHAEKQAVKVVVSSGWEKPCERDIGAEFLPLD